ncbi:hypothetical protein F5B21DRAFT_221344 [Xylaria acuta]|nr:hypothetical protein F5B21DRAFT_221344 [Xylaria acuta]
MTLKLKPSPHIDPQDPENHRNRHEEPPTSFYSCASGTGPPTSATPEYISTGLKQSSKASRRYARGKGKRERQQSDSESDDEPEPPGKSSKKKMCGTPGSTPKLACPFFMCCPHIHLRCGHSSFGRISYVVQHLERQHYESVKCDCPICGINFDTLSGRSEHLREQWCLRRNPILCAVTTERLEEIQSVSTNRSKTQHEKWVDIYKIIVGDSTPVPLPWCTDPREYFLRHFINYVSQSGDHTIFNTIMEDTGTPSQILSNYLADEQEPLQSSILQSLPTPNFLEFSVQASVSSIPEGTSMTPFQLHRPIISTPGSTVPESNEANMTNLEVMSNQSHGLGGYDINSFSVDVEEFGTDLFDFPEHNGGH